MAATVTNRGLFLLAKDDASTIDLRMAVFQGTAPAAGTMKDWNSLADVIASALTEATAANYARMDLAGLTLTEVDASDQVTWVATAPTINAVGSGNTFTTVAYYKEAATDADREVMVIDVPASPLVTNGGDVTFPALNVTIIQQ